MWWLLSKKKFKNFLDSLSKRDKKTDKDISKHQTEIDDNKLKIARLEGVVSVLLSQSQKSQSHKVPISIKKSPRQIETRLINRVRRNKKSLVIAEISKLAPSHSTIELFDIIVSEKGLCSKASFYRYISSLKSQKKVSMRQK